MIALKWLLVILGIGLFGSAGALVVYDVYVSSQLRKLLRRSSEEGTGGFETTARLPGHPFGPVRWQRALLLAGLAVVPLLISKSIVVVPDGEAGVRVSQFWGARPGTLYPGVHLVTPFVDEVASYDTREQVYLTASAENGKYSKELLTVQAREGLNVGIAVAVRYRLDPRRLSYIHANLPSAVGDDLVAPVVASTYRSLTPNYITREIFRGEARRVAIKGGGSDQDAAGDGRNSGTRSGAAGYQAAGGVCERVRRTTAERARERTAGNRARDQSEASEDCGTGSGSAESARHKTSGSTGGGPGAAGEGAVGLDAVHLAAEAEAD